MRKLKITSLILVVVMLVGMIPMGIFSASAATTLPAYPTLPNGEKYGEDYYLSNIFTNTEKPLAKTDKGKYVMNGTAYTAGEGYSGVTTYNWRGAEGLLLAYKTDGKSVTSNIWFQIKGNPSNKITSSYARATTQPNRHDYSHMGSRLTSTYNMYDGTKWKGRTLGWGECTSVEFVNPTTTDGIGWVWIPIDTFRWHGPGGYGNLENEATDIVELVGKPMTEVLEKFEAQEIELAWDSYGLTATLLSADWLFLYDHSKAKPVGAVDVDVVPNGKITAEDQSKVGLTINGKPAIGPASYPDNKTDYEPAVKNEDGTYAPDQIKNLAKGEWADGNTITTTQMPLDKTTTDTSRLFAQVPGTSLKDAIGFEFDVDSSKLGADATLNLRTRLQVWADPQNTAYGKMGNVLFNSYGTAFTVPKGAAAVVNNGMYEVFNSKSDGTGVTGGGYVQLITRTSDSFAYITGVDETGKDYDNTIVHAEAGKGNLVGMDSFPLPAGFVGTVYIPMDSFWISVYGSYSSNCLIPFDDELFPTFDSIMLGSTVSGTPDANEVTYSNFKIVKTPEILAEDIIEIDSKNTFLSKFITPMSDGEKFAGKTIRLTADIDFNGAGYTATPQMNFAGTFDGNGHVIRNLQVTTTNNSGIFGSVPSDAKVTVKNLTVLDSKISGNGVRLGGFFGNVNSDTLAHPVIDIETYQAKTKVTFINVYNDIDVYTTTTTGGGNGTGGFVGALQSDAEVIDCVYTGTVSTKGRGAGGLFGFVRTTEETYADKGCEWYKQRITIDNFVMLGSLNVTNSDAFRGGIAGYCQTGLAEFFVSNSYIIPTFNDFGGVANTASNGTLAGGIYSKNVQNRGAALVAGGVANGIGGNDHQKWIITDVYTVASCEKTANNSGSTVFHTINGTAKKAPDRPVNSDGAFVAGSKGGTCTNVEQSALPEVLLVRDGAIKQSVSITEDFALNVFVNKYDVVARPDMVNTIETTKITMTINGQNATLVPTDDGYMATFEDILPQEISDNIEITYKVGSTNVTKNTTVESYLRGLLTSDDENLVAFVADTLRYVRATQDFFGDKIANKVNTSNLPAGAGMDKDAIVKKYNFGPLSAEEAYTYVALSLENHLAVQIGVVDTALTYTADLDGTALDVVVGEGDYIKIYITPNALGQTLTVTAETGDEVGFYISDYIGLVLSMDISEAQANVLVALCNYMASATVYAPPAVAD